MIVSFPLKFLEILSIMGPDFVVNKEAFVLC